MKHLRYALQVALLFVIYCAAAKLGLMVDAVSGFAALVWPPTGIALAALLIFGYRLWPAVTLAAFLVNFLTGAPWSAAAGIAAGNTLETVLGVFLLRSMSFNTALNRVRDVLGLVVLAAAISTMVSATIGVFSLTWSGTIPADAVRSTWYSWWLGDMLGGIIVTPLLLTWNDRIRQRKIPIRSAEAALLMVSAAVVGFGLFGQLFGVHARNYPLSYFVFLPLIWAALRFGPVGAASTAFFMSALAVWGTMRGFGPFVQESLGASLIFLQTFMGVAATTSMILASVVKEREDSLKLVRENEASARESERRLSTLISNLPGFVYRCLNDRDWTMTYLSEGFKSLTGYPPEEFIQNRDRSFGQELIVPADQNRIWEEVQTALAAKKPYELVYRVKTRSEGEKWVWEQGRGIFDARGDLLALEGFITDITAQKSAQEEIRRYADGLERSNRDLEQFAYVTSHDLREPLQKIIGFSDLIKAHYGNVVGEKGRDYIERMQNATLRMNQLIDDILSFSRAATAVEEFQPVSLQEVVQEVLSNLEVQILELKAKISVGKLPVVHADPSQMFQLFQNLIGNALKFHKKDEPPGVSIEGRVEEGGGAEITIQDSGIGFDEKYRDRIFKPFERLHSQGEYHGSGIGLAICHKIVERHHGVITVRSAPGQGTAFTVALPAGRRD